MKRLLRIFALLMAASMLIWIAGCGDDDDDDDDTDDIAPVLQSSTPTAGGEQAANAVVIFNYDETIAKATVTSGNGTATVAGPMVTVTPTVAAGSVTVSVDVEDAAGNVTSSSVSYTAKAADTTPPGIDGGACDPKDGADGVDPADYPEKLVIAFNEDLSEAKVSATDPEFKFTPTASGKTLELTFLQYSMPNETKFTLTLAATDLAGNAAEIKYSFTTMAKEQ
jgi:hypothetical protein